MIESYDMRQVSQVSSPVFSTLMRTTLEYTTVLLDIHTAAQSSRYMLTS